MNKYSIDAINSNPILLCNPFTSIIFLFLESANRAFPVKCTWFIFTTSCFAVLVFKENVTGTFSVVFWMWTSDTMFYLFIEIFILFSNLQFVESDDYSGGYYRFYGHGHRLAILVAFSSDYTLPNFIENLEYFAKALNCEDRQQFITFHFGDLSMQIDCNYPTNLIDCVNNQLLKNKTLTIIAHQVFCVSKRIVE